jgi:hypothetical protein
METQSGGCQCGAVRYQIKGPLGVAAICHCRMCQKAFGSWGAALVKIPIKNLAWTRGTPATFKSSPIANRGFCQNCGTPLFMIEEGDYNIELAIGTLDNPNAITPMKIQSGCESKLTWFDNMFQLPLETTEQSRKPEDLAKLGTLQHPDHDTEIWPPL